MNIPIWPGSSSFDIGDTPFGFYDLDQDFRTDADKVAEFCTRRMGYPLNDIELQDINFYTAFEEAITTYGNEVFAFKVRDNQLSLEGSDVNGDATNKVVTPNMGNIIRLSKQYGAEAGSGGNLEYYSGSINVIRNQQDYDLEAWKNNLGITSSIEVKKVFYEAPPAITQYYDPYSGTGFGFQALFNSFGFAAMSPATNYLMMPLSYDLQTIQAIEMNQQVRKSNYSFEIINNRLRIFPIPTVSTGSIFIEYIKDDERLNNSIDPSDNKVSSVADAPYSNPTYSRINSVGRQWIFEYTLAIAKEMLGWVRSKYSTLPIPNSEVTLNGDSLLREAADNKVRLIERLREYLDQTSRQALLERRANESEFKNKELAQVPYTIYVGALAALITLVPF
jgi:hypothetical protein